MDGRWGTVCNNNQEITGAVCSQLGYPPEGRIFTTANNSNSNNWSELNFHPSQVLS